MATATKTMSLLDYGNSYDGGVVLFWTSVGCPMGQSLPYCYEHETWTDERRLNDLEGTVDEAGEWRWNGEGRPTDERYNSILQLHAYVDQREWDRLVAEYESEA